MDEYIVWPTLFLTNSEWLQVEQVDSSLPAERQGETLSEYFPLILLLPSSLLGFQNLVDQIYFPHYFVTILFADIVFFLND